MNRNLSIVAVLVLLAVLALAVGGGYWYGKRGSETGAAQYLDQCSPERLDPGRWRERRHGAMIAARFREAKRNRTVVAAQSPRATRR